MSDRVGCWGAQMLSNHNSGLCEVLSQHQLRTLNVSFAIKIVAPKSVLPNVSFFSWFLEWFPLLDHSLCIWNASLGMSPRMSEKNRNLLTAPFWNISDARPSRSSERLHNVLQRFSMQVSRFRTAVFSTVLFSRRCLCLVCSVPAFPAARSPPFLFLHCFAVGHVH